MCFLPSFSFGFSFGLYPRGYLDERPGVNLFAGSLTARRRENRATMTGDYCFGWDRRRELDLRRGDCVGVNRESSHRESLNPATPNLDSRVSNYELPLTRAEIQLVLPLRAERDCFAQ